MANWNLPGMINLVIYPGSMNIEEAFNNANPLYTALSELELNNSTALLISELLNK